MGIYIKQVSIKHKGRLRDLVFDLASFNVVFGANEAGKTLLTEFVIESLFKNKKIFKGSLRDVSSEGKIIANIEGEEIVVTPKNNIYLETILQGKGVFVPVELGRIMIIRGADSSIDESGGGVGREVSRKILSRADVLDKIEKRAGPITLQEVEVEDGRILQSKGVANTTIVKSLNKASEDFEKAKSYLKRVEEVYYNGRLSVVGREIQDLEKKHDEQYLAKRKHAHTILFKIKEARDELDSVDESLLESIRSSVLKHVYLKKDTTGLKNEINRYEEDSKNYTWLLKLKEDYADEKVNLKKEKTALVISLFLVVAFAAVTTALKLVLMGYLSTVIFLLWAYYFVFKSSSKNDPEREDEQKKLEEDFLKRTGSVLTKPAVAQAIQKEEDSFQAVKATKKLLNDRKKEIDDLYKDINGSLLKVLEKEVAEEEWESTIGEAIKKRKYLELKEKELDGELSALQIKHPYQGEVETIYNQEEIIKTEEELERKRKDYQQEEGRIFNAKQEICFFVGSSVNESWEETVIRLEDKVQKLEDQLTQITTEVMSRKVVLEAVSNFREKEDKIIEEVISSDRVGELISLFSSGCYSRAYFLDDDIVIVSDYGEFKLSDASSGTREQIMLALRIAFLEHLMGGKRGFLLLDDAFQHSDWKRREQVVKTLVKLKYSGWQVIYLTMDNHMLELFDKEGQDMKEDYKRILM